MNVNPMHYKFNPSDTKENSLDTKADFCFHSSINVLILFFLNAFFFSLFPVPFYLLHLFLSFSFLSSPLHSSYILQSSSTFSFLPFPFFSTLFLYIPFHSFSSLSYPQKSALSFLINSPSFFLFFFVLSSFYSIVSLSQVYITCFSLVEAKATLAK